VGASHGEHGGGVPIDEVGEGALVACPQRVDQLVVGSSHPGTP
jgi:hypothetical protein